MFTIIFDDNTLLKHWSCLTIHCYDLSILQLKYMYKNNNEALIRTSLVNYMDPYAVFSLILNQIHHNIKRLQIFQYYFLQRYLWSSFFSRLYHSTGNFLEAKAFNVLCQTWSNHLLADVFMPCPKSKGRVCCETWRVAQKAQHWFGFIVHSV